MTTMAYRKEYREKGFGSGGEIYRRDRDLVKLI